MTGAGGFGVLPAADQVEEVRNELNRRNPGFDGSVRHRVEVGVVTELTIDDRNVKDISPVRFLVGLKAFRCVNGPLSDLSPLKGMPLQTLVIYETGIADLKPLQGMPLEAIRLTPRKITQGLDILKDMKSLKTIGTGWFNTPAWPPAKFWARYEKGEFKK